MLNRSLPNIHGDNDHEFACRESIDVFTAFLESIVRNMVVEVTMGEDEFDIERWEAQWNKAAAGQ